MNFFEPIDPSTVIGFLVEVALKGTLVLAAAGLAAAALKSASAAVRHVVWSTALVLLLALPAFVAFAPSYDVAVLPADVEMPSLHSVPIESIDAAKSDRSSRRSRRSSRTAARDAAASPEISALASPRVAAAGATKSAPPMDWRQALFLLWLMGGAIVTARYALGWLALRRIRRSSVPVADVGLRLLVKRTAADIGLRRRIRVVWGGVGSMPLTFGCFRPTVLLPDDAREWEVERLLVVLKHELAHIKRRDCLIQVVVYLACTLYWFNPLVWVAAAQSHREREMACDDYVLTSGARGSEYAGHLLEIARSLRGPRLSGVTTIAMARPSELEGRLMAILSPNRKRETATTRGVVATFAVLSCVVMTVAALRPVAIQAAGQPEVSEVTISQEGEEAGATVLTKPSTPAPVSTDRYDEQYVAEASAIVEQAAATLETSIKKLLPRSVRLNASVVGGIDADIDLNVEGGLDVVLSDTIPLEQIRRLRSAGVDVEFIESMASVGLNHLTIDQLISLAHADVDAEYVLRLQQSGFSDLSVDDLIDLGFAGVDVEDVKVWAELGYRDLSSRELIKLAHADIDSEDVKALASLGYDRLTTAELIQIGHAGVSPEFIRAMRDMGMDNLSAEDLVRLSHADVDAEFIEQMRESGYDGLDADDLVRLSHADVDPRFIRQMSDLGLTNLSTNDLVRLGHAGIDAEFVKEMHDAGYDHLVAADLVALSHADVDAEFVREMGANGLKDLNVPDLIRLGHADIDASFIREMKESGYGELSVDELVQLSYADVDPDYVADLARAGITNLSAMDLAQLSHADIDADVVAELSNAGLKNLSTGDLIQLGFADVDGEYIAELKSVGLTNLSVSDLVMLAHSGVDADDIRDLKTMGVNTTDPELILQFKFMDIDPEYVERIRKALDSDKK